MKKINNSKTKLSNLIIVILVIFSGIFFYLNYPSDKDNVTLEKHEPEVINKNEAIKTESSEVMVKEEPNSNVEPVLTPSESEVTKNSPEPALKKDDPLLRKIQGFSKAVNEKHLARLRELFINENKATLIDAYLKLKNERSVRIHAQQKTDISRAASLKINYEFHNKLYEILGSDLYTKYLKELKITNAEAKQTKIIIEF